MNIKRCLAFLLSAFTLLVFLNGCNAIGSVSNAGIEDLMTPPVPSGENYGIQEALEVEVKNGITLKYPKTGLYQSAYTSYDIDNDFSNEAVVFYQEKGTSGNDIYIHVFSKENGEEWKSKGRIVGKGSDVYAVYFYDLDNDKKTEILVMWELYDSKTKRQLAIYSLEDEIIETAGITCSCIAPLDIEDGNNRLGLMVMSLESNEVSSEAFASLYTYSGNELALIDSITLNSNIIGYASVNSKGATKVGMSTYPPLVVVDAFYSDEKHILTQVICWDSSKKSLILPLSDNNTFSKIPIRNSAMVSRDVNGDGVIEIPTLKDFVNTAYKDESGSVHCSFDEKYATLDSMVVWYSYLNFEPRISMYAFANTYFNYIFAIPNDIIDDIAPVINEKKDEVVFYKWDSELNQPIGVYFSIKIFGSTQWQNNTDSHYKMLKMNGNLVCAAGSGDLDYSIDNLSTMISFME